MPRQHIRVDGCKHDEDSDGNAHDDVEDEREDEIGNAKLPSPALPLVAMPLFSSAQSSQLRAEEEQGALNSEDERDARDEEEDSRRDEEGGGGDDDGRDEAAEEEARNELLATESSSGGSCSY